VRTDYNHTLTMNDIHHDLLAALDKFDEDNMSSCYSLALLEDGDEREVKNCHNLRNNIEQ
jgi:hypothetical protein